MATNRTLNVRALRTEQSNGIHVFAFFAPGHEITEIAEISRVHRDEDQKLEGFQRKEIKNHVKSIIEYLDQDNVLFPNAIILALSDEVTFREVRGKKPADLQAVSEAGTLSIPVRKEGERVAWIVDGQQRSLALAGTKNKGLPVPVIAFIAPDLDTQREQFIIVNKARPLPPRLINELLPEVDTQLPRDLSVRKIPSTLVDLLNRDPESPFYQIIKRVSEPKNRNAVVSDTALVRIIRRSINNPLGALSQFKGIGSFESDTHNMYQILVVYWSSVKATFPEAWGLPPTKSRLMHAAGLEAMGTLMDKIYTRASTRKDPKTHVFQSLSGIAGDCCWIDGRWPDIDVGWNEIEATGRSIKLLTEQLVRLDYEANLNS